MHFTIITPSYNQLAYLKRCIASVADQAGSPGEQRTEDREQRTDAKCSDFRSPTSGLGSSIHVHHHIQDGGSTDGTREFLEQLAKSQQPATDGYSFSFASERDAGMYDALNRGVERAIQDIRNPNNHHISAVASENEEPTSIHSSDSAIAWLNCDEQYLVGTLRKVAACFKAHPEAGLVYGNTLNLDENGELLSYRKCAPLRAVYVMADHLYVHSASMFFRAGIFQSGNRFDTRWRAVSDIVLTLSLLEQSCDTVRMNAYLSAFTMTGENLSGAEVGRKELSELRRTMPRWIQALRWPINGFRYVEKMLCGGYHETFPLEYAIYDSNDTIRRRQKRALAGTFRFSWGRKNEA